MLEVENAAIGLPTHIVEIVGAALNELASIPAAAAADALLLTSTAHHYGGCMLAVFRLNARWNTLKETLHLKNHSDNILPSSAIHP